MLGTPSGEPRHSDTPVPKPGHRFYLRAPLNDENSANDLMEARRVNRVAPALISVFPWSAPKNQTKDFKCRAGAKGREPGENGGG
jgi:hypothetical protein